MFHRVLSRFPDPAVAREFYCHRCIRLMRIYSVIGVLLLALLAGGLTFAVIQTVSSVPTR